MMARDGTPSGGDEARDGGGASPGDDYGFSGRSGFAEGNYSGAYGRGAAGARDNPSASGVEGAGTARGGNAIPAPDPADVAGGAGGAGGAERADGEDEGAGGTGRTGR